LLGTLIQRQEEALLLGLREPLDSFGLKILFPLQAAASCWLLRVGGGAKHAFLPEDPGAARGREAYVEGGGGGGIAARGRPPPLPPPPVWCRLPPTAIVLYP